MIFEALSDKREMELRKANNMEDTKRKMHLDQALELIWRCLRWIQKKKMSKKKIEKLCISISNDHEKISHSHAK